VAVYWLNDGELTFPHPSLAEPDGLLAVGGDLSPERLLLAYRNGIFPWFEDEGHFFWYSPPRRCVLFPTEVVVHKSMRPVFNRQKFRYTLDTAFEAVMRACADRPRSESPATWITGAFIDAYSALHRQGVAHSVEVWHDETLVGGLYGLSLGRIFFGESMFSRVPNASKAGLIVLCRALERAGFWLIDCQQPTPHLLTLGARQIARRRFLDYLGRNVYERTLIGDWRFDEPQGIAVENAPNAAI
jgi:leucyl/phenylalanyl-tRNA--protein transferase